MLKQVAGLLKGIVRSYDIVGRYGGEEFLVILPDTRLEDARHLAERIRVRVKEEVTVAGPLTISLGVTFTMPDDKSLDDIIKRADTQLYLAKNGGGATGWNSCSGRGCRGRNSLLTLSPCFGNIVPLFRVRKEQHQQCR